MKFNLFEYICDGSSQTQSRAFLWYFIAYRLAYELDAIEMLWIAVISSIWTWQHTHTHWEKQLFFISFISWQSEYLSVCPQSNSLKWWRLSLALLRFVFYPCETHKLEWFSSSQYTYLNTKIVSKEAYLKNKCRVTIQMPHFSILSVVVVVFMPFHSIDLRSNVKWHKQATYFRNETIHCIGLNPWLLDNYFVTVDLSFVVSILYCPVRCMPGCTHARILILLFNLNRIYFFTINQCTCILPLTQTHFLPGRNGRSSDSSFFLNLLLLHMCVHHLPYFSRQLMSSLDFQHSSSTRSAFHWNLCDISKAIKSIKLIV